MSEEDYKSIIAVYQQRAFDLFNTNVMLETQIAQLKLKVEELTKKIETTTDDF
jgi:hypothetical protein